MAVNQKFSEYRVNSLPNSGLQAGDRYYLSVGGGKYKTFIVSDNLVLTGDAGAEYIEKDTMAQMRDLSSREIWALQNGYYKGVRLSGYYSKGDTPAPIVYTLSETTSDDDGGSVIEVGSIKLEHDFSGKQVSVKYFGVRNTLNTPLSNTVYINNCLAKCRDVLIDWDLDIDLDETYHLESMPPVVANVVDIPDDTVMTLDGTVRFVNTNSFVYGIFSINNRSNVKIVGNGVIVGNLETNTSPSGEWGHGVRIWDCTNVEVDLKIIRDCFGDGVYIGGNSITQSVHECNNIKVSNIEIIRNRRQGISVIKGSNIQIEHVIVRDTGKLNGTAPMCGIDIEPEANRGIDNLTLYKCKFYDNYNNDIQLLELKNNSWIKNVTVDNCHIKHDNPIPKDVDGSYNLDGVNLRYVINIRKSSSSLPSEIDNVKIVNTDIVCGQRAQRGIAISNLVTGVTLYNNNITEDIPEDLKGVYETRAISLATVRQVKMESNNILGFDKGIYSESSSSNNFGIKTNNIENTRIYGVELRNPKNVTFTNNIISNGKLGIYMTGVRQGVFTNNIMEEMSGNAIYIYHGNQQIELSSNIITNCCKEEGVFDSDNSVIAILSSSVGPNDMVDIKNNSFNQREYPNIFRHIISSNPITKRVVVSNNSFDINPLVSNNSEDGQVIMFSANLTNKGSVRKSVAVGDPLSEDAVTENPSTASDVVELTSDFNNMVIKYNNAVQLINELKEKLTDKLEADRMSEQQAT